MTGYRTVQEYGEAEFEVSKSRFIGSAKRVYDEDDITSFLEEVRHKYPQARHYCSAWVLGEQGLQKRYDDNKEPQGTAGMPILRVLETRELTNICIVVTRYFGGVLLGTGGLTRAYSRAAKIAVDAAGIVWRRPMCHLEIHLGYSEWGAIENRLAQHEIEITDIEYSDVVVVRIAVEETEKDLWTQRINDSTNAKALIRELGIVWREKLLEIEENENE